MKRKILIPLDGSAFSRRILRHVLRTFSPQHHRLILLRVAERPRGLTAYPKRVLDAYVSVQIGPQFESERDVILNEHPIFASQQYDSVLAQCRDELAKYQRRLAQAGFDVETAVRFGNPAREIVAFSRDEPVDAIAMTTHGRSGVSALVLGSVAAYVLRHVSVPVMLLRPVEQEQAGQAATVQGTRRAPAHALS